MQLLVGYNKIKWNVNSKGSHGSRLRAGWFVNERSWRRLLSVSKNKQDQRRPSLRLNCCTQQGFQDWPDGCGEGMKKGQKHRHMCRKLGLDGLGSVLEKPPSGCLLSTAEQEGRVAACRSSWGYYIQGNWEAGLLCTAEQGVRAH